LAGLGVGVNGGSYVSGMFLVLGVFLGSSLWWLMLSGGVGVLRIRVTPQTLRWINRISGAIIVGFGLWALSGLLP
jgi:arginine exporter protein ArgO